MKPQRLFWAKMLGVLSFLLVEAYLVGCGKIDGLPAPAAEPSIPGLPTAPPNPPVGVASETDGFYVQHLQNTKYTYVSHKGNSTMGTKCVAVAGEQITCYIEAQELDLYVQGIGIQYNIPPSMCSYFVHVPYHYFQRPAGRGNLTAQLDTDSTNNTGLDSNNDGIIDTAYKTPPCAFNYVDEGKNCCGGTYTLTSRSWDTTLLSYKVATTNNVPWGGNPANCLSGPAMQTQAKDNYGRPRMSIVYVGGTGLNEVYSVAGPVTLGKSQNVHAANFYDSADFSGSAGKPVAFTTVSDGIRSYTTSPVYDFYCLDTSQEIIAEIQLYVRSWTRKSNFLDLVANPAAYQVSGAEPSPWNVGFDFYDHNNWYSYRNPGGSPVGYPYGDE